MEKYTMFLDWKNQDCENEYDIQSNLQIQCKYNQISNGILHGIETIFFFLQFAWKHQRKTLKYQSNIEKEKWSQRN